MKRPTLVSLGVFSAAAVVLFDCGRGDAHDVWNNGKPVPEWVKRICCGPNEAHNLRNDEVKLTPQGYVINGWPDVIPYADALPSPDGSYWAFYDNPDDGDTLNCFFAPLAAS